MDNKKFAFNYLKRDSVRLLGALCYKDRQVQDKVRGRERERYSTSCCYARTFVIYTNFSYATLAPFNLSWHNAKLTMPIHASIPQNGSSFNFNFS